MIKRVERTFGRRNHLDPEAVEQGARAEGVGRQRCGDTVVIEVRRRRFELHLDPERFGKYPVHPHPRRGAAEEMVILREQAPACPRVGIGVADAERVERDALRIEHPEHIMIGMEQQLGCVAERRIVRKPAGVGMAVRADDGQVRDFPVKPPRDAPLPRIGRE